MGLILDSSIIVAAERRGDSVPKLIENLLSITDDQQTALSSIGLTELAHGIYRAASVERQIRRQSFIDELLHNFTVYPYTTATALLAGKIGGEQ